MTRIEARPRLDLHNTSVDFAVASAGGCGSLTSPPAGSRRLPHRHAGPCQLHVERRAATPAPGSLSR